MIPQRKIDVAFLWSLFSLMLASSSFVHGFIAPPSLLRNVHFSDTTLAYKYRDLSWEERWNLRYEELVEFQEFWGHLDVSRDVKLDNWLRIQKENMRRGVMRQDRIEKLAALGFTRPSESASSLQNNSNGLSSNHPAGNVVGKNTVESAWDQRWDNKYQQLKAFIETTGRSPRFGEALRLADWVNIQRENLRLGVMRKDRRERLEAIGIQPQKPFNSWL